VEILHNLFLGFAAILQPETLLFCFIGVLIGTLIGVLPGIGPVTAQKLMDYRVKQGRFTSVDELKDAKLVNSSTYEKVKDLVEVR